LPGLSCFQRSDVNDTVPGCDTNDSGGASDLCYDPAKAEAVCRLHVNGFEFSVCDPEGKAGRSRCRPRREHGLAGCEIVIPSGTGVDPFCWVYNEIAHSFEPFAHGSTTGLFDRPQQRNHSKDVLASGCSLCGEQLSVPEAAKDDIAGYKCDVEGFEGSTEAECEAAGGGNFSSYTCGELEKYLRTHSSTDKTCYSHQEQFKLKCSCPYCGGCPVSVHFITYKWISQFAEFSESGHIHVCNLNDSPLLIMQQPEVGWPLPHTLFYDVSRNLRPLSVGHVQKQHRISRMQHMHIWAIPAKFGSYLLPDLRRVSCWPLPRRVRRLIGRRLPPMCVWQVQKRQRIRRMLQLPWWSIRAEPGNVILH
jgi:hypothetical protein